MIQPTLLKKHNQKMDLELKAKSASSLLTEDRG